jgi:tRNA-dihydrouridine synthase
VAVGRGAMHNPWLFGQIADVYEGKAPREPSLEEHKALFTDYMQLLREELDIEGRVLGKLKQMAARVLKCLPNAKGGRTDVLRSQSLNEFFDNLHKLLDSIEGYRGRSLEAVRELNGKDATEVEFGKDYKN